MAQIGATIEEMHSLSSAFRREAGTVNSLSSAITGQVSSTWWVGPAADKFKGQWESQFRPMLTELQASLEECASEVQQRSAAIEAAGS